MRHRCRIVQECLTESYPLLMKKISKFHTMKEREEKF